jgi:hypothetical protein
VPRWTPHEHWHWGFYYMLLFNDLQQSEKTFKKVPKNEKNLEFVLFTKIYYYHWEV